ncbi:hypothetical protein HID58_045253 [Brassica napus]|uniref:Transposase MuDR plant domain-containing protein n=1 Tax=Brassica napus TaxID=3708 RepID=A0ABQ8ASZ4_BRANA|nr:hypothetical protein HID58_045253 [Brassica napus]
MPRGRVLSKTRRGTSYGGSPLSSPEKATRKSKRVEGESMLASTEASKTRRGTSYGPPLSFPEKVDGGSTLSPRQSKKQKVDGGSTVAPPRNSKKSQVDGDDREECPQSETNDREECPSEDENDIASIEEENCRDLGPYFGDEIRNDDCDVDEDEGDDDAWDDDKIPDLVSSDDENEEEMIPAQAYRADIDPEELLQLGKTFSDAEDFKHACLRYTLKTRYNIKYYRSNSLKMGAKCAAEMRDYEAPCPWMVYC